MKRMFSGLICMAVAMNGAAPSKKNRKEKQAVVTKDVMPPSQALEQIISTIVTGYAESQTLDAFAPVNSFALFGDDDHIALAQNIARGSPQVHIFSTKSQRARKVVKFRSDRERDIISLAVRNDGTLLVRVKELMYHLRGGPTSQWSISHEGYVIPYDEGTGEVKKFFPPARCNNAGTSYLVALPDNSVLLEAHDRRDSTSTGCVRHEIETDSHFADYNNFYTFRNRCLGRDPKPSGINIIVGSAQSEQVELVVAQPAGTINTITACTHIGCNNYQKYSFADHPGVAYVAGNKDRIASATVDEIKVWDRATKQSKTVLQPSEENPITITGLGMMKDGRVVYSAGRQLTVLHNEEQKQQLQQTVTQGLQHALDLMELKKESQKMSA